MEAVVFCNMHEPLPPVLRSQMEFAMLPVANRPIVWHIIEQCVQAGVQRVSFIADEFPDELRQALGNGDRWGIDVVVSSSLTSPEATVKSVMQGERAIVFPMLTLCPPDDLQRLVSATEGGQSVKLGNSAKAPYSFYQMVEDSLAESLPAPPSLLLLHSVSDVFSVTQRILDGAFTWLVRDEKETTEGVFVGHHCDIHPSVSLIPPVIIGAFSSIGSECVIGPYATIGTNCILDNGAEVRHSIIEAESYAGPMTNRENVFSLRRALIQMPDETCVLVPDSFLQGSTRSELPPASGGMLHRFLGGILTILLLPVLIAVWIVGRGFTLREVAGMEQADTLDCDSQLTTLRIRSGQVRWPILRMCNSLPALLDVVAGNMRCIGPEPVSFNDAAAYTNEWERLRFKILPGFFPPWLGMLAGSFGEMEKRMTNTWYVQHAGVKTDLDVCKGLLVRGWRHWFRV